LQAPCYAFLDMQHATGIAALAHLTHMYTQKPLPPLPSSTSLAGSLLLPRLPTIAQASNYCPLLLPLQAPYYCPVLDMHTAHVQCRMMRVVHKLNGKTGVFFCLAWTAYSCSAGAQIEQEKGCVHISLLNSNEHAPTWV